MREIINDMIRLRRALEEDKPRIANKIREKLDKLEGVADPDDHSAQQFLLAHRARLGQPEGPYNSDEKLAMQLEAIHLTCPKFDPEDCLHGRYNMNEYRLINQIANTYSEAG